MPGSIVDTADALVDALNAGEFSQEFTAVREYLPVKDLKTLVDLTVTVLMASQAVPEHASRAEDFFDHRIEFAVQKRVAASDKPGLDAMVELVLEIVDFLRPGDLDVIGGAMLEDIENDPVYSPEHLKRYGVFTSVVAVTYRFAR